MIYLVILFILALFAAVLYLVTIKVAIEYVRNDQDDNIVFSFYTLKGFFKYKYEIPLLDVGKNQVRFKLVKEGGKKEKKLVENTKKLKLTDVFERYVSVRGYYTENIDFICDIRNYIQNKLVLADFSLYIKEGTGNACHTGIISGMLWSAAGILTSFLANNIRTLRKCVTIKPCFDSKVFTVDFLCIFHAKLVNIIVVLIKIMKKRHKFRQKLKHIIGGGISG